MTNPKIKRWAKVFGIAGFIFLLPVTIPPLVIFTVNAFISSPKRTVKMLLDKDTWRLRPFMDQGVNHH